MRGARFSTTLRRWRVDAARALRDMDLLRIQDNVTCQAVVQVREKSTRAYVVKRQILERKSGESYKSYNPATNKLANGLDNAPQGPLTI
jgi:hypothetical protein